MNDLVIRKPFRKVIVEGIETGKGLTEQAHKKETDINFILKDYARTGFIRHAKEHEGKYDDISVQDFNEAMFVVSEAQNMFNELPADWRNEFNNNPAQFLDFVQNPNNKDKMEEMGILAGNDGIDMTGAQVGSPTRNIAKTVDKKVQGSVLTEPSGSVETGLNNSAE